MNFPAGRLLPAYGSAVYLGYLEPVLVNPVMPQIFGNMLELVYNLKLHCVMRGHLRSFPIFCSLLNLIYIFMFISSYIVSRGLEVCIRVSHLRVILLNHSASVKGECTSH